MIYLWILIALVAVAVFIQVAVTLRYVPVATKTLITMPRLLANRHQPIEDSGTEEVRFGARNELSGTYLKARTLNRKGVILCCHEFLGDRWNMTPYFEGLREAGYDLFTFDFRAHGQSEARGHDPIQWATQQETEDVQTAVEYLSNREDADPQGIGVIGVSRGGTAAFCVAADDPRVRAIAVDGLVPIEEMQLHYTRRFMNIFAPKAVSLFPDISLRLFGVMCKRYLRKTRKVALVNVNRAARRTHAPVLLIHGKRDSYIPPSVVKPFCKKIRTPWRLWIVPDAKHNGSVETAGEEYTREVCAFFTHNLSSPERDAPATVAPLAPHVNMQPAIEV